MAQEKGGSKLYVFSVEAVRRAIEILSNSRLHEHLPGYLALLRNRADPQGAANGLSDITAFFRDFLQVEDAPAKKPFLRPFRSKGMGPTLMNANLQGSYAPSSIREGQALSHVIKVVDSDPDGPKSKFEYRLVPEHASAALANMLAGNKIPAIACAAFIFRDHSFELDEPSLEKTVEAMRAYFRITDDEADGELTFSTLFEDDNDQFAYDDLVLFEG